MMGGREVVEKRVEKEGKGFYFFFFKQKTAYEMIW